MPDCPTEAQSEASRLNGALSHGPQDTSRTRFNATRHGFTASLSPPTDPEEARFFEQLLSDLAAHKEPKGRLETLLLEEIAGLELRRVRVQQAILDRDLPDSEDSLRLALLFERYEGEIKRKLDRGWVSYTNERKARLAAEQREEEERLEAEQERFEESGLSCFPGPGEWEAVEELLEDDGYREEAERLMGPEAIEAARRLTAELKEAGRLSRVALDLVHRILPLMRIYWEERGWDWNRMTGWYNVQQMRAQSGSFREIGLDLGRMIQGMPEGPAFTPRPECLGAMRAVEGPLVTA